MELTFIKHDSRYIGDIRATSHFNLHIEGEGRLQLFRKTAGEVWKGIAYLPIKVLDSDVAVNIPADYRMVLDEKPTMLVVTMGEEVYEGVFPADDEPEAPEAPEGYEQCFDANGEMLFGKDGEILYVKL